MQRFPTQKLNKGGSIYDVRKIFVFFDPLPPVTVTNQLILFISSAFGDPLPSTHSHCGRHIWKSPKRGTVQHGSTKFCPRLSLWRWSHCFVSFSLCSTHGLLCIQEIPPHCCRLLINLFSPTGSDEKIPSFVQISEAEILSCTIVWGIRLLKKFCQVFSESSSCLLWQHGSCSTAQRPVELSENILQYLFSQPDAPHT